MSTPVVPRTVKGLAVVSLFNDFASELVYPLLPAFVTRGLGGGALALSALDGAADLTAAALRWFSGRLADRPGWRKPLILVGYGTAVLVRPLISVTAAAWQVIGFRVLDRVGKGLRTPARDALIAEVTPAAQRGRAFGFHRAADHLGAVAGSLAAWLLLTMQFDVRDVIGLSAVPGVLVMLVLAVVLRPVSSMPGAAAARADGRVVRDASGAAFWVPALILVLLVVGRIPETLLLLRLQDLGVPIAMVPLAWAGLHVVRTVASYPGGWLSDHLGPRWTMILGSVLFAAVLAGLAMDLGAGAAVAVFLVLGVTSGLTEAAEKAMIAALAPVRTGTGFGSYQAVAGVAALPMALGFGAVYQWAGAPAAMLASGGVVVMAALLAGLRDGVGRGLATGG